MNAHSRITAQLPQGVVLDVTLEELRFTAYVVISPPDIELVADFVPESQFESDGDLHVTAVPHAQEAAAQVEDITFNMNLGDAAVFMCADQPAYHATLEALGQAEAETPPLN